MSIAAPFLLLISALSSLVVFFSIQDELPYQFVTTWFVIGGHTFSAGVFVNILSATMLLVVTFISFLVHVYSIGYMAGDASLRKYFAMLGLFTFSMLAIVLADNLLLLFVGWELVGFSSYMLIGHWKEKPEAARAAKKAFILNRIGDAGFLVGLMILWTNHGSFDISGVSSMEHFSSWQTAASLCLFCGVIGKSAQFPLLTWLPDAMEGPTPVSALIHAATMVAAGVYLMIRIFPFFTPTTLDVVSVIGIITALVGACAALGQYDIKKILAYSTISQLGLMVTAVGLQRPMQHLSIYLRTHFSKHVFFLPLDRSFIRCTMHSSRHVRILMFRISGILEVLEKNYPLFSRFLLSQEVRWRDFHSFLVFYPKMLSLQGSLPGRVQIHRGDGLLQLVHF